MKGVLRVRNHPCRLTHPNQGGRQTEEGFQIRDCPTDHLAGIQEALPEDHHHLLRHHHRHLLRLLRTLHRVLR